MAPVKLHALVIGINTYKHGRSSLTELRGAVPDAKEIYKYLRNELGVAKDQIKTLYNERATRSNIIRAIRAMGEDRYIRRGDAILIYFAGHGGLANRPAGWPAGDKIQMLLPYDFLPFTTTNKEQQGLYDITVDELLRELANKKGDNIVRSRC